DLAGANGWTALHYAAASGAADCADLLLIAGAEPNPETADGQTPLSLAADSQTAEILRRRGGRLREAADRGAPEGLEAEEEPLP
ncbi:MAG: ankyrin repeat domain-containing protein, partial [Armatimonadetes bacterium]|nr:ankyrin repeat domain-containing protein [Armatimonadota bacterium]